MYTRRGSVSRHHHTHHTSIITDFRRFVVFRTSLRSLLALGTVAAIAHAPVLAQGPNAKSNVIEVKMVEISPTQFTFTPAKITVKQGDVVRFTQTKVNVHNVEFKATPAGADLGALKVGPYLMTVDQVYEFTIDKRFVAGNYDYVCTPHETMGMKGQIIVTP